MIVSDGAGQFNIAEHALCWVHAERLIHKLDTVCEAHVRAKDLIRHRIWWLYADLKAYRHVPPPRRASELRRRFSRIFGNFRHQSGRGGRLLRARHIFRQMGLCEKAITDYSRVIELRYKDADAYNNGAWAYYSMGDPAHALEDAGKALQIRSCAPYALDTRGGSLELLGRRSEAVIDYEMALRLNPDIEGSKEGLKRLGAIR